MFFGEIVEEALQAEYSKDDCSAESCVQNVAIKFNGEVVVDASVQIVEADIYFRMKFLNVITGELEAVVQEACASCSFSQLLSFVGVQAASVRPTKSAGLTGLLEQRSQALAEPAPEPQKTAPQNVPIAKVENPRPVRKAEVKSPSYWRWGLGALVLAAGGGGGGGGGGGEDGYGGGGSGDGASTTTQTPFNGAGSEYVDNPNMLGGGHTYITVPSSSNNYRYYGNSFSYGAGGSMPDIQNTNGSLQRTYLSINRLFQFQTSNGTIQRMTVRDSDSPTSVDFDVLNGGTITQSLPPENVSHLSYFTNDNNEQFLGLALTNDYQTNVGGIARVFFGVLQESGGSSYDRDITAYHGGQVAPDNIVPTSGVYEFEGYSAGHWVSPNDFNNWTTSEIEVQVDFSANTAQLISSNTLKSTNPTGGNSWTTASALDFSVEGGVSSNPKHIGAFTTDADDDELPIIGPDGPAEGGAWAAYFYEAPSAMETSGSFTFYGAEGDREAAYVGAFGARRE